MNRMGKPSSPQQKLFILSAPSGAGKTTLCQRLLSDFPNLSLSISSTTRSPRKNEEDGKHYIFISADEFRKQIDEERFAEWANVHGNYYGTSKDTLERFFAAGKSVLLDIDVQGAASLRAAYPDRCITVFVTPPDLKTLEERLRARGTDSEEVIQKRLANASKELAQSRHFDYRITNDDLESAYQTLKEIVSEHIPPQDEEKNA